MRWEKSCAAWWWYDETPLAKKWKKSIVELGEGGKLIELKEFFELVEI